MKKVVGMSLAAALLLGANAFAFDNVKVSGDAKLYYNTDDKNPNDLFSKASSAADTALRLGVTGELLKNVTFGVTGYAISTLGLENNLVSNTWSSAHTATNSGAGNDVSDEAWIGELWIAAKYGNTTVKAGRMLLDSPLSFSEMWSVAPNSYEAFVLINQDIPDTTLVAVYAGHSNGVNAVGYTADASTVNSATGIADNTSGIGLDGIVGANGTFGTHGAKGANVFALINNSYKPLTAQAWYYNVVNAADAFWLQGDLNSDMVKGLTLGAQYTEISPKGVYQGVHDSKGYAFKVGYEGLENFKVSAAYSDIDKDSVFKVANLATNNTVKAQSKLYTEAFWNYGYVGTPDAESWNLSAQYNVQDIAKFGAYYTNVSIDKTNKDMKELALSATKSFGALDTTLAYISTDADDQNSGSQFNSIQARLTLNF
ncbi:MAG: hypothetical protein A3I60_00055 [Sulfuricurvum sp. RIFCSPLOWO2_02_FULL_43_45]|nr:MAG: hypothetical protein A3D90_09280 [Sulfuricurvum sp. RIFCSPHIGHO2_02_FULL_43_9]OHD86125.1 MAG: hypothetical protein A3I60_00055 [Sulfuricurvum sp. RIFCSPLOWO2_02_FULL_43_45]